MKEYSEDVLAELEKFIDNYLDEKIEEYGKDESRERDTLYNKIQHIKRTATIAAALTDNKLVVLAAKYHDIGRIPQLEFLGGFRDDLILHHNLGEDLITRMIFKKQLKPSVELDTIRQAIMYHGRMQFIPFKESPIEQDAIELTEIISVVDDLDNGCIGALGYLERETVTDAKGYKAKNPDLDMKEVSPRVMEFFRKGEKFDKLSECNTYADYILFASVLAIQSLKGKYSNYAKKLMSIPCFGYNNALEGYKDLYTKFINPEYAMEAFDILSSYYSSEINMQDNNSPKAK